MRRCMSRKTSSSSAHTRYLPRRAEPLARARPCDGVDDRLGRQRQAPARVGDLQALDDAPLDEGRELAADRLDLGELGHRRQRTRRRAALRGTACREARRPRGPPATAASRRRRRPAGRRGGARPGPRRSASSGACSRVWSVCGARGSTPWSAVSTSRSSSRRSAEPLADGGVDLAQRAVEALDVLAVAVDLVGLDQVGEDEARRRARAASSPMRGDRRARSWRPGGTRRCRRRRRGRGPCRRRGPATPALVQLLEVASAPAARPRSPCAPRCARTRPARRRTAARSRARPRARRSCASRARWRRPRAARAR